MERTRGRASGVSPWLAGLALALTICAGDARALLDPRGESPAAVWDGFDPRAEPLDVEVMRTWTEGGSTFTECTFTGMSHGEEKVRVYAIYGAPTGGTRLPGVLHIHGGGQTVNERWLRFWNERGYAALTFNWGGEWPGREKYTRWGPLRQGNHRAAGSMLQAVEPSVRASSWYLWTRVSRRALTLLERQPAVDPERLGIFGVSMGGTIVWPFAAMDRRVRAACAIYGAGWNTYPDERGAPDPRTEDAAVNAWRRSMEPEAYAPLVRCPLLFLNATNDQHGKMDWVDRSVALLPGEARQAYTPRFRHHIAAAQGANLPLWMDTWLKQGKPWPASPEIRAALDASGVPVLTATPDQPESVTRVELFYALENRNPKNRFWRSARVTGEGTRWSGPAPVLDAERPFFAFANVHYSSGICLSSRLLAARPADLGPARATGSLSPLIDDFSAGVDDWVTRSPATDPIPPVPSLLRAGTGPGGKPGITVTRAIPVTTHKIGDPAWRAPEGAALRFRVFATAPRAVRVVAHENEFGTGWKQYIHELRLRPAEEWQTVRLAPGEMTTQAGEPLARWSRIGMLELDSAGGAGEEPVYTEFEWVPARE